MKLFKPRHGDLVTTYHVWKLGNIGSGNGMLPDGTKPLFEPMLIYHQWGSATTIRGQHPKRYFGHQYLELSSKLFYKMSFKSPRGLRVNQFQTKYRAGWCTPQCQMLWSQWQTGSKLVVLRNIQIFDLVSASKNMSHFFQQYECLVARPQNVH